MEKIGAAMDIVESVLARIKDSPPPEQAAEF
jgi:hypothetical protein